MSDIVDVLKSFYPTRKLIYFLGYPILENVYGKVRPYLNRKDKIVDIGAGPCILEEIAARDGFEIIPLDIRDIAFVKKIKPIIYDGKKTSFKNKSFNLAIISYVLHHTKNPDEILIEAKRIAEKVLIREEIYFNPVQKYLMFVEDSLLNFEFLGHPHTNRPHDGWLKTFKRLGFQVLEAKIESHIWIFAKGTYLLSTT